MIASTECDCYIFVRFMYGWHMNDEPVIRGFNNEVVEDLLPTGMLDLAKPNTSKGIKTRQKAYCCFYGIQSSGDLYT